jgi:2'-hydroxyisoflavone reductase
VATNRRNFIKLSAAAAAGAVGLGAFPDSIWSSETARARKPLNILILGGTGFMGPEQVEYAIKRGHSVTLLNRNRTRPDFFKGRVDQLIGDMNADVSALKDKKFDVVIDNPTMYPAWVRNVAQYMKGNTSHYIFISTVSAYANDKNTWADESDPLAELPAGLDPYALPADPSRRANYGPLKAFSEKEVEKHYPGINTIIRPGLIVGPLDVSDRFTYWPYRLDKGGEVLAPGDGKDPVQIIDVRDIAEWTIRMAENKTFGTFNATGPLKPYTMSEMLEGIKKAINSRATFTWVPADFLAEQKVRPWSNMPVWMPDRSDNGAWSRRKIDKALATGLTFRPLAVTAKDTLEWNKKRPEAELQALAEGRRAGISAGREAEVLKAWKEKQKSL